MTESNETIAQQIKQTTRIRNLEDYVVFDFRDVRIGSKKTNQQGRWIKYGVK
jgi:hypothetical protein